MPPKIIATAGDRKACCICNRPRWDDVYSRYMNGTVQHHETPRGLYGTSLTPIDNSTARVWYAVNPKTVFNATLDDISTTSFDGLHKWLLNNWCNPDHTFDKQKNWELARRKIKGKYGVCIVKGQGQKYATLWKNNRTIDGRQLADSGADVYFWKLINTKEYSNPRVFSEKEFSEYKKHIQDIETINDKQDPLIVDCITAVVEGMRVLLDDETISIVKGEQMDRQMEAMRRNGYAENTIPFDFKDSSGKRTTGNTDPDGFWDKSLSDIIFPSFGSDAGYYFWGLSIMCGYHSAIAVVNNTNPNNPTFNIFDQKGSLASRLLRNNKPWYSAIEIDSCLIEYVNEGYTTDNGQKGTTTTRITPIKHYWGD